MTEDQAALMDFGGVTPIFPLPHLVFFPNVVQPLHIFEPRYREMTADALEGDRFISLVQLLPGWEDSGDDCPEVAPVVCLGRIIAAQQLPDGRYNLLLRGLSRARISEEIPSDKPYRLAKVKLLQDEELPVGFDELGELRERLQGLVMPRFGKGTNEEQLNGLFQSKLPMNVLSDVLGFFLPIGTERKQILLETLNVRKRAELLCEAIMTFPLPIQRKFPPEFSRN